MILLIIRNYSIKNKDIKVKPEKFIPYLERRF